MRFSDDLRLLNSANQSRWVRGVLVVAVVVLLQGCAQKQVRVRPWATAIAVRPHVVRPVSTTPPDITEVEAPDISFKLPPLPTPLSIARQPARPRVAVLPVPEPADSRKPSAPLLEPELTAQEVASAQQQMNESIAVAQRNLDAARGRRLNPAQTDLTSKVTSFLQESKQAVHDGDWTRARNLAKKAQVLSEELAASL